MSHKLRLLLVFTIMLVSAACTPSAPAEPITTPPPPASATARLSVTPVPATATPVPPSQTPADTATTPPTETPAPRPVLEVEALLGIWQSAGNVGRLKDVYILIGDSRKWAYINDVSGNVNPSSFEGARAFGTYVFADGEITFTSDEAAWSCAGQTATYRYFFNTEGQLFSETVEEPCRSRGSIFGSGLWEKQE